jgi:anti-anti-sigma factor
MVASEQGTYGQISIVEPEPGHVVAVLAGELDLVNADLIDDQLGGVVRRGPPRVLVLDAASVDFCDCAALHALLRLRAEAESVGCRVVISAPSPPMLRLLRLFEVDRLFGYPPDGSGPEVPEPSSG